MAFLHFLPYLIIFQRSIFCNFKNGQKSIFELGKSLKLPKMQFHINIFWFIWFHELFCLDFFKSSGPLCTCPALEKIRNILILAFRGANDTAFLKIALFKNIFTHCIASPLWSLMGDWTLIRKFPQFNNESEYVLCTILSTKYLRWTDNLCVCKKNSDSFFRVLKENFL